MRSQLRLQELQEDDAGVTSENEENSTSVVIVHKWRNGTNHIALEIKYDHHDFDPIVGISSSNLYFSFDEQKKQVVRQFGDDVERLEVEPCAQLTFYSLCANDIIKQHSKLRKHYKTGGATKDVTSVGFIDELLVSGGLQELSKYYVTTPTLTQSFISLIAGGLLLLADNDVAKIIGAALLTAFLTLWIAGCYQRRTGRDCFGEVKPDADYYYDQVLKPARQLDIKRMVKRVPPLRDGRNNIGPSGMLCSLLGLVTGGGILAGAPGKFIVDPTTGIVIGAIAIGFGCLCCVCCCQITYEFRSKFEPIVEDESRVDLKGVIQMLGDTETPSLASPLTSLSLATMSNSPGSDPEEYQELIPNFV